MNLDGTTGSDRPRQAGFCVARGTPIATPLGAKAVQSLKVGDQVWGYDVARCEPVVTRVAEVVPSKASGTVRVGSLHVTADHPVFVDGQWKSAGRLEEQDQLLSSQLAPRAAGEIENIQGEIDVYDIAVDEPHNFFAGGVLVHNKTER